MNWLRGAIVVLIAGIALFGAWHLLAPKSPPAAPAPPPEQFDPSKPLGVEVTASRDTSGNRADVEWLARELRSLLARNGMHVAPVTTTGKPKFVLSVEIAADGHEAHLVRPAAADNPVVIDRMVPLPANDRLSIVQAIAAQVPALIDSPRTPAQWIASIGTDDAATFEDYFRIEDALLGPSGHGFIEKRGFARTDLFVGTLDGMTKRQPTFARAWSMLALHYLTVTGKDEAALAKLARTSAERALALDASNANAHAAVALASLRDNDWTDAGEHLRRALELDPNSVPALEASACLAADTGGSAVALELAQRTIALQPHNVGATECAVFATGVTDTATPAKGMTFAATAALLGNDVDTARKLLPTAPAPEATWSDAVLRAAADPKQMRHALQALTRAANENQIDPLSEILSGAALRQPDFLFNRLLRLKRQHEPAPLRVLWLPQTQFLRQHERFKEIVDAFDLPAYWQATAAPDLCASETTLYGCRAASAKP
jgi:Tfp pilus assembly protein PilF